MFWFTKAPLLSKKTGKTQFHFSCFHGHPFPHWPWTDTRSLRETENLSRAMARQKLTLTFTLKTENSTCKLFLLSLHSSAGPHIVFICLAPWGQTLYWQRLVNSGKSVITFLAPFLTHWWQKWGESMAAAVLTVTDMGIRKMRASFAPFQK